MNRILIVVDMQHDFVSGTLGSADARAIVSAVASKVDAAHQSGTPVIFTRDTHPENYLDTFEGQRLPVAHCIAGTPGHELIGALDVRASDIVIDKPTFGSLELAERLHAVVAPDTVLELCGLCTDICVISNALLLRAHFPSNEIVIDASACAGVTPESHLAALAALRMCQVDVI